MRFDAQHKTIWKYMEAYSTSIVLFLQIGPQNHILKFLILKVDIRGNNNGRDEGSN